MPAPVRANVILALQIIWADWAINSSFKTESQLQMTPATFIPRDPVTDEIDFTFQNYGAVFRNERFQTGLINSTIVAVSTTLLSLVVGSFAAFALGKLRFRGRTPSLYIILSMTMFPQVAVGGLTPYPV